MTRGLEHTDGLVRHAQIAQLLAQRSDFRAGLQHFGFAALQLRLTDHVGVQQLLGAFGGLLQQFLLRVGFYKAELDV